MYELHCERVQFVVEFENTLPTACMNFIVRELCRCLAAGEGADGPVPQADWQAAAEEPAVGQAVGHCAGGERGHGAGVPRAARNVAQAPRRHHPVLHVE